MREVSLGLLGDLALSPSEGAWYGEGRKTERKGRKWRQQAQPALCRSVTVKGKKDLGSSLLDYRIRQLLCFFSGLLNILRKKSLRHV